ncbi:MAG: hypothetical protein U0441_33840 [Polyangiaceae bacterium]
MRHRLPWMLLGTPCLLLAMAGVAGAQPAPTAPPPAPGPTAAPPAIPPSAAQPPAGQPPSALPPSGQPAPGQPPSALPTPGQPTPPQPPPGQLPSPPPAPIQPGFGPGQPLPPGQFPGSLPPGGQGPFPGPNGAGGPPPLGGAPLSWGPPQAPAELPGVHHGVPLDRRGQVGVEVAAYTSTQPVSGQLDSVVALGLNVHMPIATRTFADVRIPMASYFPGNIMLGVDRVGKMGGERGFLAYGIQVGLPLAVQSGLHYFSLPNGTWNIHEYQPHFLPLKLAFNYERLMGESVTVRLDLEPIVSFPVGDYGYNVGFTFQHAAEVQYGHGIGVGMRVQGVAISDQLSPDAYQLAVEPFAVVQRDLGFARLGLMLPIDGSVAGPPFEQSWGLRLWAGLHID